MVAPLELPGNITYEFDPEAVYKKDDQTFLFISIKKTQTFTDKKGNEQKKFQNLTAKSGHGRELGEWLKEVAEELLTYGQDSGDAPF